MEFEKKSTNELTLEDPLPLSNNDLKVEFSNSDFCMDPRDYHHDLQPFDYDGHRIYLVGSSFSPDLSIPFHCFDPFDLMASENFSTDLSPFLEQSVENASVGNDKSSRGKKSRKTQQLRSANDRFIVQCGNNGTRTGKRPYHLRSDTNSKRKKVTWKEDGEDIIPQWDATERSQFLEPSSCTSFMDDWINNLNFTKDSHRRLP